MHVSEFRFDKRKYYFVGLNTDPRNGTIKLINTSRGPFWTLERSLSPYLPGNERQREDF